MQNALFGKRVLITQSTEFMGPVLCAVFAEQGATVIASSEALVDCSAGSQRYIEDCPICCRPIEFQAEVDGE
jgi:2-keto-3-deoxy-L-fuconate dehydrogenase